MNFFLFRTWVLILVFIIQMMAFVGIFLNIFVHLSSTVSESFHSSSISSVNNKAPIQKLVIVVLDAFRTSFVFSHAECLPVLRSNAGLVFNVRTFTPTVTSPRIKTLTTGTVPEFADVFFNLQSSEVQTDSLLKQWNVNNRTVAFYGDDTWLKLFPKSLFLRYKEVSSFYAVDFTEVDNAVSEPLINFELMQKDWNVLILHYLGLDHIGHSRGPDGELVCKKLLEMDGIFNEIIQNIIVKYSESMLVVMGDHGMSNEGSHGGSTDDELYTPFILSSKFFGSNHFDWKRKSDLEEISQVDIATSIALLTGVSIPDSSLGLLPALLLEHFPTEYQGDVLRQNYEHLLNLCQDCGPYVHFDAFSLTSNYAEMKRLQEILLGRHSSVNRIHLCAIVSVLFLCIFSMMTSTSNRMYHSNVLQVIASAIFVGILNVFYFHEVGLVGASLLFSSAIFVWPVFFPIYFISTDKYNAKVIVQNALDMLPLLIANAAVIFSSSFVEEEHFFWNLAPQIIISFHIYLTMRRSALESKNCFRDLIPAIIIMFCVRLCKAYIYPGVKWAEDGLDYARFFRAEVIHQAPLFMGCIFLAFLILLWHSRGNVLFRLFLISAYSLNFLLIFRYKSIRGDLRWWEWLGFNDSKSNFDAFLATPYAQASYLVFFLASSAILWNVKKPCSLGILMPFFFQLGCLLLRCYLVVPLFLLLVIAITLPKILETGNSTLNSLLIISLSRMSFSALENSNRLATVDVGAAYTGLTSHHPLFSGIIVFIATAFGPLFIFLSAAFSKCGYNKHLIVIYQCVVFSLCACCITIQANHLFVWSVFAPKLLYEVFWTILIFIVSIF